MKYLYECPREATLGTAWVALHEDHKRCLVGELLEPGNEYVVLVAICIVVQVAVIRRGAKRFNS